MSKRKPKQIGFDSLSMDFALSMVPKYCVIINTQDMDIPRIVKEMLHVPTNKSILLDFWVGHQNGESSVLDEDHADLLRLQYMLNYRNHGRRFDWLADQFLAKMIRLSLIERKWDVLSEGISGG